MTDRGRETRARLIEAAAAVVAEVGYAHASTRAIARAAGVAEGTIYRHFPDKSALFFAAVMEANAPIVDWVGTFPSLAGRATVEENLTECLVRLASMRDQLLPLELAIAADPELSARHRAALAAGTSDADRGSAGAVAALPGPPEGIAAYLATEQALGRVRPDVDPRETAIVLLAALIGLAMTPGGGTADVEARVPAAVAVIVRGIAPESAPRRREGRGGRRPARRG